MILRKALIVASAFMLIPTIALAQQWTQDEIERGIQKKDYARYVKSGSKTAFYFFVATHPDCSTVDGYEVTVSTPPQHGKVEFEPSQEYASWSKDNPRFKCNEKKIRGTNWVYHSHEGYRGKDEFEITVYTPDGTALLELFSSFRSASSICHALIKDIKFSAAENRGSDDQILPIGEFASSP